MNDEPSPEAPKASLSTAETFELFRQMLAQTDETSFGVRSLTDNYPPNVIEKAEEFCRDITERTCNDFDATADDKKDTFDLSRELIFESDRGCILIASALMDEITTDMTKHLLCSLGGAAEKAGMELLEGRMPPLGTAWAKETFLLAIGAIDEEQKNALKAIRDLRNRYAHRSAPATLTKGDVDEIFQHLDPDDRAIADLMANRIGAIVEALSQDPKTPFGVRYSLSPIRLRFVVGFSRLMGSMRCLQQLTKERDEGMDQLMQKFTTVVVDKMIAEGKLPARKESNS
jgi:hypothetical protein